jgi:biotin/methionine sulfoxide reductase
LIYWAGGNPFHHHQDLNRLRKAWTRPETVIVHEQVWNGLAKHADIVLPATYTFERNDISVSSRDSHMFASRKVVEPFGQARNDFEIFSDIASHLGFADAFTERRGETEWLKWIYDGFAENNSWLPDFETFWKLGHVEMPRNESNLESQILLDDFRADPVRYPLTTPSGKIEIYSSDIASYGYDDCLGHAAWLEPAEWLGSQVARKYPLHLLSNQPTGKLHSQLDFGTTSARTKVDGREPIIVNASDAADRHIRDGDTVRVFNDRGQCLATAVLSNDVRHGVVRLSTGAWVDFSDPAADGSLETHGNPNVLTLDIGTSRLGQGTSANTCLVEMELYRGSLPKVRAYDPPEIDLGKTDFG